MDRTEKELEAIESGKASVIIFLALMLALIIFGASLGVAVMLFRLLAGM